MNDKDKNINKENIEEVKAEDTASEEVKAEDTASEEVKAEDTPSEEVKAEDTPSEEVKAETSSEAEPPIEDKINASACFLLGKKIGMTSIYDDDGIQYPTTVIEAGPCYISQIKSIEKDGYEAVQIGYLNDRNANKPKTKHFENSKLNPMKYISEFKVENNNDFNLGEELKVNIFNEGEIVKVSGVSKGKGFAGVMKRHGFGGGRASHGKNSVMRKPGSVGAGADPSRIWKGKKMPGRYGGTRVTLKGLEILKVDTENNLLFVKGAVPGANNGLLTIYR